MEKVVLKSVNPEEYGDLVIECRVIPNDEIGDYVAAIPEERKFSAYKVAPVGARVGKPGEEVKTVLITEVDGKKYFLSEENNVVRTRHATINGKEGDYNDIVVTNSHSTSNEQYVVKAEKFATTYQSSGDEFVPVYDCREFAQVDENVIIMTTWGAPAICLAGSYIVTYNASNNDYNTVEQGAFDSTYIKESGQKVKKENK